MKQLITQYGYYLTNDILSTSVYQVIVINGAKLRADGGKIDVFILHFYTEIIISI